MVLASTIFKKLICNMLKKYDYKNSVLSQNTQKSDFFFVEGCQIKNKIVQKKNERHSSKSAATFTDIL